ncbi:MAG TPA: ChaN family lipoprotein [Anaeromyxobacteraceae bacterium]|nr:ChaN family lipoprotein [Anaeromyxobacteraceae bacterium]
MRRPARPSIRRPSRRVALAAGFACALACALPAIYKNAPPPLPEGWESTGLRGHPLVGRIWDVRAGRFVELAAAEAAVARADFVFLGETHDNPDHHRMEARFVRAVTASGRRPALAFEMLDTGEQAAVDAALAKAPKDPDAVAAAVKWDKSGWPPFASYRPVFEAGLDAGLRIVAANLSRKEGRDVVTKGPEGVPAELRPILARDEPLPPEFAESLRREMRESHCGELPEKHVEPMVLAQRARDARMAERLVAAAGPDGAILVTGAGHAREDHGVPVHVARLAQGRSVASIAVVEVVDGQQLPSEYAADYGASTLPFDFVVFTPRQDREDPCEGFREHMKKKARASLAPPSTPVPAAPPSSTPPAGSSTPVPAAAAPQPSPPASR